MLLTGVMGWGYPPFRAMGLAPFPRVRVVVARGVQALHLSF
jgi:hypothetical protein